MTKPLIAGNWKMNGLKASETELRALIAGASNPGSADVLVCPPATLIARFAELAAGSPVRIGGQDCHQKKSGAFTGDVSAAMIADAGGVAVIVGHSERRAGHDESDAVVKAKAEAALAAGLAPIVCVGETEADRLAGRTLDVVTAQLDGSLPDGAASGLVVAYEPVWAIGTGRTPTLADIAEAHAAIRERLKQRLGAAGADVRILYGGSMKPDNAGEILKIAHVDGGLVGGASLKASDFLAIIGAVEA